MVSEPGLEVVAIDHVVLRVRDVDESAEFYRRYLGGVPEMEAEYRAGDRGFLSIRLGSALFDLIPSDEPEAAGPRGVAHICLEVRGSESEETRELLAEAGVLVEHSVSQVRLGAKGGGDSLYLTDPDGYRIELKWYG